MARTSTPPSNDNKPPPSAPFHSQPSDLELVKSYLRPWVDSGLKAGAFIHVADIYATGPATLSWTFAPAVAQDGERAWYFLTPLRRKSERGKRKQRTVATGEGWWHNEAKSKPVVDGLDGRRHVGYRQSFSFMKKEGVARTRTGWLMLELRLDRDQAEGSEGSLVLCKVYRSPRHPGEPASMLTPVTPKREAAGDDDESSASRRPKRRKHDDEGSDATLATAGRRKSDGEGSSAATVAAPRNADGEIPDTVTAAAPGHKDHEDSAETSAAAPGSRRKAADEESSVAASAAEPAHSKRKITGELNCPQCGCHLDAEAVLAAAKSKSETKSEPGMLQVEGNSSVKGHSFHQFF